MKEKITFPPEWYPQSAVQLTWPHEDSDWATLLGEVVPCFQDIAREVVKHQQLLVVCRDEAATRRQLREIADGGRILFREMETNDTWARDHAALSVFEGGVPALCDFVFNGWGMKYPAALDNLITRQLYYGDRPAFAPEVKLSSCQPFVLEGGSIDTDGEGTLLTTTSCLLSANRNEHLTKAQIENYLQTVLGLDRILWLEHGYLAGDDTGGHVDTLARFCSVDSIAYVQCTDPSDEHYESLRLMENELKALRRRDGSPYLLLPLPMADAVVCNGERLPATYANFLIINGAVLVPFYGSPKDQQAATVLREAFPNREIKGIDCRPLIKQHGSLHCVTMQYPIGFI